MSKFRVIFKQPIDSVVIHNHVDYDDVESTSCDESWLYVIHSNSKISHVPANNVAFTYWIDTDEVMKS